MKWCNIDFLSGLAWGGWHGGVGLSKALAAIKMNHESSKEAKQHPAKSRSTQKRIKVDHVGATLPASSTVIDTVIEPHHDEPPPSEEIGDESSYPCDEEYQSAQSHSHVSSQTKRKERVAVGRDSFRCFESDD